jgi:hypothetical protein
MWAIVSSSAWAGTVNAGIMPATSARDSKIEKSFLLRFIVRIPPFEIEDWRWEIEESPHPSACG